MALLTISITDQLMDRRSAEVVLIKQAVDIAISDLVKLRPAVTTTKPILVGSTIGAALGAPSVDSSGSYTLGSWTYTPSATNP